MDDPSEPSSVDITKEDLCLRNIKIKMTKLNNIRVEDFHSDLEIVVNYGKENLGRFQLKVDSSKVEIDFTVVLAVNTSKYEELNGLTGIPIEFFLIEASSKRKKQAKQENLRVKGRSNLDLLPIILGELVLVDQRLLLESIEHDIGEAMMTWTEIPILYVDVEVDKPLYDREIFEKNNFLFLTLESIYNLDSEFLGDLHHCACIEMPVDNEIFETVKFADGSYTTEKNGENFKFWNGMSNPNGKNAKTKYRVSEDHHMIHNQTGQSLNFKTLIAETSPRITWNSLKRFFLKKEAVDSFKRLILEKKYFPVEILITKERDLVDGKAKPKSLDSQVVMHLVSYVDLSMLMYPGSSRVRVASPIVYFDKEEYSLKSRSGQPFFYTETNPLVQKDDKDYGKKSKGSSKRTSPDPPSGAKIILDAKMFLVTEFEFLYPIVEKPTKEFLYSRITELVPPHKELPMKLLSKKNAEESFRDCLILLHDKLSEEYDSFMDRKSCCAISESQVLTGLDLTLEFKKYLFEKNIYSLLKETLKKHVTEMFRYEYAFSEKKKIFRDVTEETHNIFIYIVKKMHKVLNSFVEGQRYSILCEKYTDSEMQLYFGLEALEEDKFDTAKGWYLKRIDETVNDAEVWVDYAIFLMRLNKMDEALLSLKKVLEIDSLHCVGLLLYAAILTDKQSYDEAGMFFQALTEKYSDCRECWISYNIYFTLTDDLVGQQNTFQRMVRTCHSSIRNYIRLSPILCWRDIKNLMSPYLEAVSIFLRINAFKFAEVALAKELARTQNPESYSYCYYLAVLNYMRGNFEESAKCLARMTSSNEEIKDLKVLYGHVNYKLEEKMIALNTYKYILDYFDCNDDLHMIFLRIGSIYLEDGLFDFALESFANACAHCPTPHSWLQTGIAAYKCGYIDLAEFALSESNKLDKYEAETWGYLALINLSLDRREAYNFCHRQAKLLGIKNEELEKEILHLQKKSFSNESI